MRIKCSNQYFLFWITSRVWVRSIKACWDAIKDLVHFSSRVIIFSNNDIKWRSPLSQREAHSTHLQNRILCFFIMFDVSSYHPLIHLQLKHSHQPSEFMNSRHDCENCWGPSLSLDDFYSLETRERGKIMGDCNIECDATVTRPRIRWWPGPGLVPSLISLPIKSCRNISNWSISEEKKEERMSRHGQLWHSRDQIYFLIEVDNQ